MKLKQVSCLIGMALAVTVGSPLVFAVDNQSPSSFRFQSEEPLDRYNSQTNAFATFEVKTRNVGNQCSVMVKQVNGNAVQDVFDDTEPLAFVEMSFLDPESGMIIGSENIIAILRDWAGVLTSSFTTTRGTINNAVCIVNNISVSGNELSLIRNDEYDNIVQIPIDVLTPGPISNLYIAIPLLADLFISKITENYADIDYKDLRLIKTDNVENYEKLVKLVVNGSIKIKGANDAGYSLDFLELEDTNKINDFLSATLVENAVNLGIVDARLNTPYFSNYLRKVILAALVQDSEYTYGSNEQIKATIALRKSQVINPKIQLDTGSQISNITGPNYLLEEFERLSVAFKISDEAGRTQPAFENPDDKTLAIYNLPFQLHTWSSTGKGNIGDIYVYDNPYSEETEIFQLNTTNYGHFPTDKSSNEHWEYLGPRTWREEGRIGDIYVYENPYNNAVDLFKLKGSPGGYFPTDRTSNNDWTYLDPDRDPRDTLVSPEDEYEFATYAKHYSGLDGIDLARAVLEQSGNITIDESSMLIYSDSNPGGLLGKNVLDIAAIAFDVEPDKVTRAQLIYTSAAFNALLIDTIYPYGSLNNAKATVYNRIVAKTEESTMLEELGTGVEPFVMDEIIANNYDYFSFDINTLVKDFVGVNFRLNGVIEDETQTITSGTGVQLYDDFAQSGDTIVIGSNVANLESLGFNDRTSSISVPEGWSVRFYEHANYQGRYWSRTGGASNAPVNNIFSSIKILSKPEPQHITLYSDSTGYGKSITLTDSLSELGSLGFDNSLVKFSIPDGWQVRFYEHENFKGEYWTRVGGDGVIPTQNFISSVKVVRKGPYSDQEPVKESSIADLIYEGLQQLETVRVTLEEHSVLVAYDNGQPIKAIPITDELYARAQLFKYGLNAKAVDDLWKTYIKKGFLRLVSDNRITSQHLANERNATNTPVQDMWDLHFNTIVPVASDYLATLIDYKAKLSGLEPLVGKNTSGTMLRIVHGMTINEHIQSQYFNGVWNRWSPSVENWLIYGPNIDYSVKTANNIYDFMSVSDITFDKKYEFFEDQQPSLYHGTRDMELFKTMNKEHADKYCTVTDWDYGYDDSPTQLGVLNLEAIKWSCGLQYMTRAAGVASMHTAYGHIIEEVMKYRKWDLKTVQTDRDILYMILQIFIPVWGTVESFKKGDTLGGYMGLMGDVMFFTGVGMGTKSALKPTLFIAKTPSRLLGQGVSLILKNSASSSGALVQVNRVAAKISAKNITKAIVKSTLKEMNPVSGVGDLARGVFKKSTAKKLGNTNPRFAACSL